MQASNHQPRIVVARSVLDVLQQAGMGLAVRSLSAPEQSIGGILVGKRLSTNQIAIVAASTPGPAPDNRQLGFALDQTHANATLEDWFTRDAAVDFVGVWHTHPTYLARPPAGDVEIAQKLLTDPAYNATELVNLIVHLEQHVPRIRCFYLGGDATSTVAVNFVPYEIMDDKHPVPIEPGVTALGTLPTVVSPAKWRAVALVCLLVVLLGTLALVVRQVGRFGSSPPGAQSTAVATRQGSNGTAIETTAVGAVAPATAFIATLPAATTTSSSADTAAIVATTPAPLSPASPVPSLQATAGPLYALRLEPMDAAYRQGFLNRLRVAKCVGCYNVDLVSPVPFREMRLKFADSVGPPLSTYAAPSPAKFPPRAQPYTLQAVDPQGQPLSEPLTFTVVNGGFYVLRITPLTAGAGG